MPRLLLQRLHPDSIREFNAAADERFRDAVRLADADRRTASIYFFGYAVEMLVKVAFLRVAGHAEHTPITTADLRNYVGDKHGSVAHSLGLPGAKNLHDIFAWVELLIAYRSATGQKYYHPEFSDLLRTHVITIHTLWSENLRYHRNIAYNFELNGVRTACEWIREHRDQI